MTKAKKEFWVQTKTGTYRIVVWWDKKDQAYLVRVPSLPEVVTFGKTLLEAKKNGQRRNWIIL